MGPSAERRSYLSIREVLDLLLEEFSDITISKIRFLESRGLIHPERTPSGYRKFFETDVERLRWILRQQRENFLPLKVIKGRLDGDVSSSEAVVAEQLFPSADSQHIPLAGREASSHDSLSLGASERSRSTHSSVAVVDRETQTILRTPTESLEPPETIAPAETATAESVATTGTAAPPETVSTETLPPTESIEQPIRNEVSVAEKNRMVVQTPAVETPITGREIDREIDSSQKNNIVSDDVEKPSVQETHQREVTRHRLVPDSDKAGSYTVDELAKASGADVALIVELQEFGLVEPHMVAGVMCFDEIAAEIVRCAVQFARFGLEPRHLNAMHHAAEREAGLYATVVTPLVRQRNPEARERATRDLDELTVLGGAWREAFIRAELRHLTGG